MFKALLPLSIPGSSAGLQQADQPDGGHVEGSGANAVPLLTTQPHRGHCHQRLLGEPQPQQPGLVFE